jgi:hypothetical protein
MNTASTTRGYTDAVTAFRLLLAALALVRLAEAQRSFFFPPQDGGMIFADPFRSMSPSID